MSLEKAESYLKEAGFLDHVIELKESTATVALAAEALGCLLYTSPSPRDS